MPSQAQLGTSNPLLNRDKLVQIGEMVKHGTEDLVIKPLSGLLGN